MMCIYITLYQGLNIFSASVCPMREPKRAVPRVAITTRCHPLHSGNQMWAGLVGKLLLGPILVWSQFSREEWWWVVGH